MDIVVVDDLRVKYEGYSTLLVYSTVFASVFMLLTARWAFDIQSVVGHDSLFFKSIGFDMAVSVILSTCCIFVFIVIYMALTIEDCAILFFIVVIFGLFRHDIIVVILFFYKINMIVIFIINLWFFVQVIIIFIDSF